MVRNERKKAKAAEAQEAKKDRAARAEKRRAEFVQQRQTEHDEFMSAKSARGTPAREPPKARISGVALEELSYKLDTYTLYSPLLTLAICEPECGYGHGSADALTAATVTDAPNRNMLPG